MSQAEAELEARWTDKAGKMVAQADEKWKRRFQEVLDEKEEASRKLLELQEKASVVPSLNYMYCVKKLQRNVINRCDVDYDAFI